MISVIIGSSQRPRLNVTLIDTKNAHAGYVTTIDIISWRVSSGKMQFEQNKSPFEPHTPKEHANLEAQMCRKKHGYGDFALYWRDRYYRYDTLSGVQSHWRIPKSCEQASLRGLWKEFSLENGVQKYSGKREDTKLPGRNSLGPIATDVWKTGFAVPVHTVLWRFLTLEYSVTVLNLLDSRLAKHFSAYCRNLSVAYYSTVGEKTGNRPAGTS